MIWAEVLWHKEYCYCAVCFNHTAPNIKYDSKKYPNRFSSDFDQTYISIQNTSIEHYLGRGTLAQRVQ